MQKLKGESVVLEEIKKIRDEQLQWQQMRNDQENKLKEMELIIKIEKENEEREKSEKLERKKQKTLEKLKEKEKIISEEEVDVK